MEYRSNSKPEDKEPDSHNNFPFSGYLTLKSAIIIWDGPRYLSYNKKAARLRSYTNW